MLATQSSIKPCRTARHRIVTLELASSVTGQERVDSDGTVLNLGEQRLGQGWCNCGLSPGTSDRQWQWFSA